MIGNETQNHTPMLGYRPWFDGMRGFAVLLVVLMHLQVNKNGFLGVDIFFVLSGFLITALLIEERERTGRINLVQFYMRRALRLFPALWLTILGCALAVQLLEPENWQKFKAEARIAVFYLTNFVQWHQTDMPRLAHTWSLSIEEQFYLLWPILFIVMLKTQSSRIVVPVSLTLLILGVVLLRLFLFRQLPKELNPQSQIDLISYYCAFYTRADSLLTGCLTAVLWKGNFYPQSGLYHRGLGILSLSFWVVVLGVVTWHIHHRMWYYGFMTLVALATSGVIVAILYGQFQWLKAIFEWKPLVMLGKWSYGIYLYHLPIIYFLRPTQLGWKGWENTFLVLLLTLVAATISYYGIERPILRLKKYFDPKTASPVDQHLLNPQEDKLNQ